MDRLFENAVDKYTAAVILYAKSAKLYTDSACTVQASASDVAAEFQHSRIVVSYENANYLGVAFANNALLILTSADGKTVTPVALAAKA